METMTQSIERIAEEYLEISKSINKRIVICAGTGCIASGAIKVYNELKTQLEDSDYDVSIKLDKHECGGKDSSKIHLSGSGCQGFCAQGPLVNISPGKILYVKVKSEDVPEIIEKTIAKDEIIDRLLYINPSTNELCKGQDEIPFYKLQKRVVLNECGLIDPESIQEYISLGGYSAAKDTFLNWKPEDICNETIKAGLRGRGGGGFPTGKKWDFARVEKNEKKYVICNGDEGDPGAFMDRSLMEGNPHRVLEGMMIASRAIGADEAYVYVRLEYPLAVERMKKAIVDARNIGVLGNNIFDSGYNLDMQVMEGAGAFVCGEETALMSSIEGKRGMPLPKPPFPAKCGLFGKPTIINNVETLAAVPLIFRNDAMWFRQYGTERSPGTKTFALTGHVANTGLIEVPFGTTLREIVYNIGGGIINAEGEIINEGFKAVQIGGPSGGCLTENELDLPLDYDNLIEVGAMVGSGGLVVMNKQSCMIQIAKFFMEFTQNESCGKCVPCREGTKQMLSMLEEITEGTAEEDVIERLTKLGRVIKKASLCGLGKTAPSPVLSTIEKFKDEYLEHINAKYCATGNCKALSVIEIDTVNCIGCTACARKCPTKAISGNKKEVHIIDPSLCTKCGICDTVCKFNAIIGF